VVNTLDTDRLERLHGLARIWGALYLYHPALTVPDPRWEQILTAAIPKVEAAATPVDFAAALNEHLLRHLDDPCTVASAPTPLSARGRTPVGATRRPGGALWIDSGALAGKTLSDRLLALARKIGEADERGLILDWRWAERPDSQECLVWRAACGLLLEQAQPVPAKHERIHYGWSEESGSVYHSNWFLHGSEVLQPPGANGIWTFLQLPRHELERYAGPVAIIVNEVALASVDDVLAGLQRAGRISLVLETGGVGFPSLSPETLWGGVEAHLRLHRLALPDGWIMPEPDRTLAAAADPAAGLAAAEALLGTPPLPLAVRPFSFPSPAPSSEPPTERAATREERLAGLFKIWMVLGELFPHLEFAAGDWRHLVREWTPRFERAENRADHELALLELAATLNDSHVRLTAQHRARLLPARLGGYAPPVALRDVEGKAVIAKLFNESAVTAGLRVGTIVTAIDGRTIESVVSERGALLSASTPQWRRSRALILALIGPKDSTANLTVHDGADPRTVKLVRDLPAAQADDFTRTEPAIRHVEEFGYLDLDRIETADEVARALKEFAVAPGLILDMRGYPRCPPQFSVVPRLIRAAASSGTFGYPVRSGTLHASHPFGAHRVRNEQWLCSRYIVDPDQEIHYGGPVVVLIDETAASSSEDFCIYLRNERRAVFVGKPTAGTNGNVTHLHLPVGVRLVFTGMRVTYADGSRFQNIGILPDVEARPTLAGFRAGRDEVLEAGVATLRRLVREGRWTIEEEKG
jgi:C-terminal processing protease CtpA/Prc